MPAKGYDDRTYRKKRDAVKARAKKHQLPCHLCGQQINWEVDWKHPKAFTADHIEAVATGGKLLGELRPAHRGCNSRRGKKPLDEYFGEQEAKAIDKPKTTRKWYG